MPTLDSQVKQLAQSFAAAVVAAIRSASIQDIIAEGSRKPTLAPLAKRGPGRPRKIVAGAVAPLEAPKRGPGRPRKVTTVAAAPALVAKPTAKPAAKAAAKPAAKTGKGGRLGRRSPADIDQVIGLVVKALGDHKTGLRSEQLQKTLKLSKKEIVGPIAQALASKKISKKGERRATTYFAK